MSVAVVPVIVFCLVVTDVLMVTMINVTVITQVSKISRKFCLKTYEFGSLQI